MEFTGIELLLLFVALLNMVGAGVLIQRDMYDYPLILCIFSAIGCIFAAVF